MKAVRSLSIHLQKPGYWPLKRIERGGGTEKTLNYQLVASGLKGFV